MDLEKQMLIAKGAVKHLPWIKKLKPGKIHTGTIEARYCYTVWLRHLLFWNKYHNSIPETVAELGPGDSLGTGLAAILSGSNHLFALDVDRNWNSEKNLKVFDELVELFTSRNPVPGPDEYPKVRPRIPQYVFPSNILSDDLLGRSLSQSRIDAIRNEISDIDNPSNTFIKYHIPWQSSSVIQRESVDLIYSQAVLECVDDLERTYVAMRTWLKPYGMMSHTIDFRSHGLTKEWNGHWKFSELEWFVVKGGRKYLLNRQPVSKHIKLHTLNGFDILVKQTVTSKNNIDSRKLAGKFRQFTDEDLNTSGVYLLSCKSR